MTETKGVCGRILDEVRACGHILQFVEDESGTIWGQVIRVTEDDMNTGLCSGDLVAEFEWKDGKA